MRQKKERKEITIDRIQLTADVAKAIGVDPKDTRAIIDATLATIRTHVKKGHRVELRGFGTFQVKVIKGRSSNLPQEKVGKKFKSKTHRGVRFKSSRTHFHNF